MQFYEIRDTSQSSLKILNDQLRGLFIKVYGDLGTLDIKAQGIATINIKDGAIDSLKIGQAVIKSAHIDDAQILTAHIANAQITNAKISNLEADRITGDKIAANTINAYHIEAGSIDASSIKTGTITAESGIIANGAITTAMIGTGVIGTSQIADGSITDAKIVELTANKITAGTLSVERLVITGSNKSIVFKVNEVNGTAQLSQTTIDGGSLTQRSITADRIVAGAITANEIAAKTITANNMVTGTITAASGIIQSLSASVITTGILQGGNVVFNLDAATFRIGQSDSNYCMKYDGANLVFGSGTTISWSQVTNQPNIPTLPSYITSTKITSTSIESPNIIGGSISGGTVTVSTLLDINNSFPLFSSAIQFHTGSGTIRIGGYTNTLGGYNAINIDGSLRIDGVGYFKQGISTLNGSSWGEIDCGSIGSNGNISCSGQISGSDISIANPPWAIKDHTHTSLGNLTVTSLSCGGASINSSGQVNANYLGSYGNIAANGNLTVSGTKNCLLQTINYGKRLVNAYETAEYYFGDIGRGNLVNGICTITFDPIFTECVNTNIQYEVFLTKYAQGEIWVDNMSENSFTVIGDNIPFVWEIKAKRKGYETDRLKEYIAQGEF